MVAPLSFNIYQECDKSNQARIFLRIRGMLLLRFLQLANQNISFGDFIGLAFVTALVALVEEIQNRIKGGKW